MTNLNVGERWREDFRKEAKDAETWSGSSFGSLDEGSDGSGHVTIDWDKVETFIEKLLAAQMEEVEENTKKLVDEAYSRGLREGVDSMSV